MSPNVPVTSAERLSGQLNWMRGPSRLISPEVESTRMLCRPPRQSGPPPSQDYKMGRDVPGRSGKLGRALLQAGSGLRGSGHWSDLLGFAAAAPQSSEIIKELIEPVDNGSLCQQLFRMNNDGALGYPWRLDASICGIFRYPFLGYAAALSSAGLVLADGH
jgi:hypothetical protein